MAAATSGCGTGCAPAPAKTRTLRPVVERLSSLLARADFIPPYELYAEILGAGGGRRALLARLGAEAEDPVEEFLGLALAYEREHAPSLQGFLHWLAAGETEVKRDFGARQRDEVRILTVHGAKGLEAPVVFLPDTMQLPNAPDTLLWAEQGGLPLWCPPRGICGAVLYRGTAGTAGAPIAGIPAAALCRAEPGAGPALYLRLADKKFVQRDLLARPVPSRARRNRGAVRVRHDGS